MKVLKPFNTPTRRFAVGDDFDPANDIAALPLDSLIVKGFIEGPPQPAKRGKASKEKRS